MKNKFGENNSWCYPPFVNEFGDATIGGVGVADPLIPSPSQMYFP